MKKKKTYIDRKFLEFLEIFLKDPRLDRTRRADPAGLIELMTEFERLKLSITAEEFKTQKGSRSLNFANIIYAINEDHRTNNNWDVFYGKSAEEEDFESGEVQPAPKREVISLKHILDEYKARVEISHRNVTDADLSYIDGLEVRKFGAEFTDLVLPMGLICSFFEKVIGKIVEEVEDLVENNSELQSLKYIILCGGFAECTILQEEVKSRVNVKVLVPKHPSTVVQKGAVQYGFDPNIISTRRARQTIGVKVTMRLKDLKKFNPKLYKDKDTLKEHTSENKKGEKVVKNLFNVFIHKGEEISTSHFVTRQFQAPSSDKKVKFDIYATDDADPKFITDDGCTKLASLQINVNKGSSPKFEYIMNFASTEIQAKVKNMESGETKELMLLYNSLADNNNTRSSFSDNDSLVAVKIRDISPWGGTAFDIGPLDERELLKKDGVSEML